MNLKLILDNKELSIEILSNILHGRENNKKVLWEKYNNTEEGYHELYEVLVDNGFILGVKAVKSGNNKPAYFIGIPELSGSGKQLLKTLQSKN